MKIFIIGANGYLGSEIYYLLNKNKEYQVYGSYNTVPKQSLIKINLFSKTDLQKIISIKPNFIIWCVSNPENEIDLSENALKFIIQSLSPDVKFIYFSTTIGKGRNQNEGIEPFVRKKEAYLSTYFNGKIIGESIVSSHLKHLIIRPGSIYGVNSLGQIDNRSIVLKKKFELKEKYSRTANMYMSYVNVKDLALSIEELLFKNIIGIINIAGKMPKSHYDFYKHLANLLDIDSSFIVEDFLEKEKYHNLCSKKREQTLETIIKEI
jgi:dTDP-4-dehydrorhamnose reductase